MIPMKLADVASVIGAACEPAFRDIEVRGVSIDSRTAGAGDLFFAVTGDHFDGHDFVERAAERGAVGCVVRAGTSTYSVPSLVVGDTVAALTELAWQHRRRSQASVVAVTGSNGKTTTKNLIAHILSGQFPVRAAAKSFNNHLGVPLTLLSARPEDRFLVVEVGTSAPGEISALAAMATPDAAVITSIGEAHLEGLGGIDGVAREKLSLLRHVQPGGWVLVNADRAEMAAHLSNVLAARPDLRVQHFGRGRQCDFRVEEAVSDLGGVRWRVNGDVKLHLPIPGVHNAANGTAAYAVARHFGMDDAAIAAAMATFRAAEMRLSTRRFGSLTVIDDCYNANPASMAAGIEVLAAAPGTRRVLVAGEMRELGVDSQRLHRSVGERAAGAGIDVLAGVGAGARDILDAARVHRGVETHWYPDAATAAPEIARWAQPDDVILVKGSRAVGLERVVQALAASGGMEDGTKRVEAVVAPSGPA